MGKLCTKRKIIGRNDSDVISGDILSGAVLATLEINMIKNDDDKDYINGIG